MSTIDPNPDESQSQNPSDSLSPVGGLILLEQLSQISCSTLSRPMLKGINHKEQKAVFFKPRCKLWSCETCSDINRRFWAATAAYAMELLRSDGVPMDFVTVTSHERLAADASLRVLPLAWNNLNRRLSRAAPTMEYMAIPELHKNGRVHVHALVAAQLKKRWWKDNARAVGMGYQSDAQEVKSIGGAAFYVSKYIGKQLESRNIAKGFRRIRLTQGFPRLPEMMLPPGWIFLALSATTALNDEMRHYQALGYRVALADGIAAWDFVRNE